jgi:hypothetical protein
MKIATSWTPGVASSVAIGIAMTFAGPARAQSAEAETLFREGKRLMKQGQIAEACDKLDASDRLEPTVGTELNLADCREQNGQLATAWAIFVKAAATAKRSDTDGRREAEARRRAAVLEPQLVYLTIVVPADRRVDGLVIKRNATVIDRALWDQRVPVDPDDYKITARAPGYTPWTTSIAVKTKNKKVELPVLEKRAGDQPATASDGAVTEPATPEEPVIPAGAAGPAEPSRLTGTRKLSIGLAVVGVAAIGLGVGFGRQATSTEDQADAICPDPACGDAHAVDLNATARSQALVANLGFAVGGAAIIGAAVLWFTGAPKPREALSIVPTLAPGRVGIQLARAF